MHTFYVGDKSAKTQQNCNCFNGAEQMSVSQQRNLQEQGWCQCAIVTGTCLYTNTTLAAYHTLHCNTAPHKRAYDIQFSSFCWPTTPCRCIFVDKILQAALHFSVRHQFEIVKVTTQNGSKTKSHSVRQYNRKVITCTVTSLPSHAVLYQKEK